MPRKHPPKDGPTLLAIWRGERKQALVAPLVGLDVSTYCAFEIGRKKPGKRRAARIEAATAGGVPAASWKAAA